MNKLNLIHLDEEKAAQIESEIFEEPFTTNMLKDDNLKLLFGLIKDNQLLGYAYLHGDEEEMEIYRLGILRPYRKNGYGKYFLNEILNNVKTKRFLLEVRSHNLPAINLYLLKGFTEYYKRKNYYTNGDDAIMMEYKNEGNKK